MFLNRFIVQQLALAIFVLSILGVSSAAYAGDVPIPSQKPPVEGSQSLKSRLQNFLKSGPDVPEPDEKPMQKTVSTAPSALHPRPKEKPKTIAYSATSIAKLYYNGDIQQAHKAASYQVRRTNGKEAKVAWIAGLSAWRLGKYTDAAAYFERAAVAPRTSSHLISAAAYWAGRANMRAGKIENVSYWYNLARKQPETFYGLLATRALGVRYNVPTGSITHSAYINDQYLSVRPELIRAIVKQESKFNPSATNPSGATGLMQILPSTASYITGDHTLNTTEGRQRLKDPSYNLKVGQKYLRYLLKGKNVRGNLLYLLIAYNAGPGNLSKWKRKLQTIDDGLLFIESIPSSETRAYIERVLTTYWLEMLHRQKFSKSLDALAAGEAPMYPSKI